MALTRRSFLKSSSALALGMMTPAWTQARQTTNVDRNSTLNVGLIGCGAMGMYNLRDFLKFGEFRCTALCDVDKSRLETGGNEIASIQTRKPELYSDYRKLLDSKEVDAVIIASPDHWHCKQFVDACIAGKDIYIEKPIANSIAEAEIMEKAAQKYNRIVQVGQQQRSGNLWRDLIDYLKTGDLGIVGRVHVWANFNYAALPALPPDSPVPSGVDYDAWLGPAPQRAFNTQRFHGAWRMFWDYGGGLMTDWGVHLLDIGLWGMNIRSLPEKIFATGGNFYQPEGAHETFDTLSVAYRFDKFAMTWENNAGVESGPYGKNYGILFKGTNGTLVANRDSWQIYPEGNKIPEKTVTANNPDHEDHIGNFLNCLKTRNRQTACPLETGSLCVKYAQMGNISARSGGVALHYDEENKSFGNPEADKYLKPTYRFPLEFPI
jgi:predicted dehydrogenase